MKLEIHLRPESRSMLVRIPNSTIRKKIVDQEFWHIGNVLFYVAQWSATVALHPPSFTSMPLWAHFRGIPFDLYTQEGLGRVGDLLGIPIEVDEFTRRMVDISVAHIKCRIDCTKPLPRVGEIERDNGELVTVTIDYPWVPPICSCCSEIGHLESHCPAGKWRTKQPPPPPSDMPPPVPQPVNIASSTPSSGHIELQNSSDVLESVNNVSVPTPLDQASTNLVPADTVLGDQNQSISLTSLKYVAPNPNQEDAIMILEPDGTISTPHVSPHFTSNNLPVSPSPSPEGFSIPFDYSPFDNQPPPPSKITHLLAFFAVHHPRPVKFFSSKKSNLPITSSDSKFPLSLNPFACLSLEPPSDSSFPPPLSSCPPTLPSEGSLQPAGEIPTH